MHGEQRNAEDYRNDWRNIYNHNGSDNSNFILLAPQFEQKWFPKATGYNLGNMFTQNLKTLNPQEQWAFTEIENLFDFVKQSTKINTNNYYLYGHSAGAQFVHRMIIFLPHARIKLAVAAEARSYTILDESADYPCGLKKQTGDQLPSVDFKKTFSTPMTIILGTKDHQPLSDKHDTYSCDAKQGSNRLARGEYFYAKVKSIAEHTKEDFRWVLKEVNAAHIVAHTNPPIEDPVLVSCAAKEFFPKLRGVNCE
jgi:poly(3-hydroxybutyrate) depolymerase